MDLRKMGWGDGRQMELAQDRVQWRALVLVALNLQAKVKLLLFLTTHKATTTYSTKHHAMKAYGG
jgi:hypothetical protein